MNNWKERIIMMLMVKNALSQADNEQLWEYHYPEVAVHMKEILSVQKKLNVKFSEEYTEFLQCANGWKSIYQLVDLFGTKDFDSESMEYARKLLNTEMVNNKSLNRLGGSLFPIAVSQTDKDLFVMVLAEGEEYGQVIWLAGGEVERFASFCEFFDAMIEYNKQELEDMTGDIMN